MGTKQFVRTPFVVEAEEITRETLAEWAEKIGVDKEVKYKEGDNTPYILVDKRVVPNVYRVFAGFWITKMGDNIRCYSPKIFREQFTPMNADWESYFGLDTKSVPTEGVEITSVSVD